MPICRCHLQTLKILCALVRPRNFNGILHELQLWYWHGCPAGPRRPCKSGEEPCRQQCWARRRSKGTSLDEHRCWQTRHCTCQDRRARRSTSIVAGRPGLMSWIFFASLLTLGPRLHDLQLEDHDCLSLDLHLCWGHVFDRNNRCRKKLDARVRNGRCGVWSRRRSCLDHIQPLVVSVPWTIWTSRLSTNFVLDL